MNSLAVHFSKDCQKKKIILQDWAINEKILWKYWKKFNISHSMKLKLQNEKEKTGYNAWSNWQMGLLCDKISEEKTCNNGQRSLHALNVVSGNKKDQSNFSLSIRGGNNRIYKSFILNNGYWQCKGIFHHSIDCVMFCKKERNWFLSGGIVKAPNITPKKSISSDNINFCFSERPQLAWVSKHCYPKVSQSNIFKWRAVCRLCLG